MQLDKSTNRILYDVKFRDDRKVQAMVDNILAPDETDLSILPTNVKEFIQHAKCLTQEDVKLLQNPPTLSPIEKEWKAVHDQYGHLPLSIMDKLVENNILPSKFSKMKGKKMICPSCMFGKMCRRTWRSKGQEKSDNNTKIT